MSSSKEEGEKGGGGEGGGGEAGATFVLKDSDGHIVVAGHDEQSVSHELLRMVIENMARHERTRAAVLKPGTVDDYLFVNANDQGAGICRAAAPATLLDIHAAVNYLVQATTEKLDR